MIRRYKAMLTAARYRRTVRAAHQAYEAIQAVLSDVEYFDREILSDALSALNRVPGALITATCTMCGPSGYYECADGACLAGHGCNHPRVERYATRDGVPAGGAR